MKVGAWFFVSRPLYIAQRYFFCKMKKSRVRVTEDEEFDKELKVMLAKPKKWWLERAERAIRGDMIDERKSKRASRRD